MSFTDEEIRENAPGGLARVIGSHFLILCLTMDDDKLAESNESFDKEHKSIFEKLIDIRMENLPNEEEKELMKSEANKTIGVLGLCAAILKVEGDLHLNDTNSIKQILRVMAEELRSSGVGSRSIFGATNNTEEDKSNKFDYHVQFSTEHPSE